SRLRRGARSSSPLQCRFEIVIRPGRSEDAEAVARVHVETWQAAYAHALPAQELADLSVAERIERHRRWPPTFVAEVGGEIVGFVGGGGGGGGGAVRRGVPMLC